LNGPNQVLVYVGDNSLGKNTNTVNNNAEFSYRPAKKLA
jgi:hypothetical protein